MKTGRPIETLANQILEESKAKKDYVAPTTALNMVTVPREGAKVADVALQFAVGGQTRQYAPTSLCLGQIADRVGIPAKYAERMRTEAPELLARNINHWFQANPEKRMLRTLSNGHNVARAFLSSVYRPLDNFDLFAAVMPKLQEAGCIIRSAEITETRFYIQASTPRIQAVIDQNVKIGTHTSIQRTIQAGIVLGNSEVGCGSIFVQPLMYDLVCTNGLILERALKRHHVGRRNEGQLLGDDFTAEIFSDDTRKLDDQAFWSKVSDVVLAALNQTQFNSSIDRLKAAQGQEITAKPAQVIEVVSSRFTLNDAEKENVLLHYIEGNDHSKYGLMNAVTRTAEDCDSYDRAIELERAGNRVLELPLSDFLN